MSKKLVAFAWLMLLLSPLNIWAVEVNEVVLTTAVIDREPVDSVEVFPRQSGKLFCFTKVLGAETETFIAHLWYREGQLMAKTTLPVRSPSWRTWSAKDLLEEPPGSWRVEVQDEQGNLLKAASFEVR